MEWYRKLYLGKTMTHKRSYYKYLVEKTKRLTGTYCILLSPHPGCLLDICRTEMVRSPQLFRMGEMVVGIAGTVSEARELAGRIIADTITATGSTDVRAFLSKQETAAGGDS